MATTYTQKHVQDEMCIINVKLWLTDLIGKDIINVNKY
jgi:hypothetical protein